MLEVQIVKPDSSISLADFGDISDRATAMMAAVRQKMLDPHPRKHAPTYSLAQVAELCKIEKSKAAYYVSNNTFKLPTGTTSGRNNKREFTLVETQEWIKHFSPFGKRPEMCAAIKAAIANFKGGVTKTTTTMALAQGLSLRGRKVLLVDLDPQGSLTALNGIISDQEVTEEQTIYPLIDGRETSLKYAIQPTYWNGIDLIPASISMYGAEFLLPSMQVKNPSFEFWDVLNKGLNPLLNDYDVILFDTPPSLSYMTINALLAADAMIVPTPPNALDFASSSQFWSLIADLTGSMIKKKPSLKDKRYAFVSILLTKTDQTQISTNVVRDWIRKTYGALVLDTEIPITSVAQTSAAEFGTVYDDTSAKSSAKTYNRAREAYDNFAAAIDEKIKSAWSKQHG